MHKLKVFISTLYMISDGVFFEEFTVLSELTKFHIAMCLT